MLQLALKLAPHPVRAIRVMRTAWRFRARGWAWRPPFLPLPPREYLEWRLKTAYGRTVTPAAVDVEQYLSWVDRMQKEVARR